MLCPIPNRCSLKLLNVSKGVSESSQISGTMIEMILQITRYTERLPFGVVFLDHRIAGTRAACMDETDEHLIIACKYLVYDVPMGSGCKL
jgi:hypothetical protein